MSGRDVIVNKMILGADRSVRAVVNSRSPTLSKGFIWGT